MKKLFAVLLIVSALVSCGEPIGVFKTQDYTISYWKGWRLVEFKANEEHLECAITLVDGPPEINVKVAGSFKASITLGHIREVTKDYAVEVQKASPGYTLVSKEYKGSPSALGDERYEVIFSAVQNGQAYNVVQHLYALDGKAIYVTGTFPEGDETLKTDILQIMDSFLLIKIGN